MSMGRRRPKQRSLFVSTEEQARAPRHRFYEALNRLLREGGFDEHVEKLCASYYAADGTVGRDSVAPGVYFRMLLVGYFEGIESERGLCWRFADSLSLKAFLGLEPHEPVPDHSTLSRTRQRLGEQVYLDVFHFVLGMLNREGLLRGKVAGVDATYLRADASMRAIVRRGSGEGYKGYLKRLAKEAGIKNPTDEDARRLDRQRRDKRVSNAEWESKTDPDAEITRLKDGRTRLAYKAEHVVDMQSGAVVSAAVMPATTPDSTSVLASVDDSRANIERARELTPDDDDDDDDEPTGTVADDADEMPVQELTADKGYHKASTIRELQERGVRTYFPEPRVRGKSRRWRDKGGRQTATAVYQNRARTSRPKGRELQRTRGEKIERSFAHICDSGGQRRSRLRGRRNVQKRYLIQVAAFNLGILMRHVCGYGTPRGLAEALKGLGGLGPALVALLAAWRLTLAAAIASARDALLLVTATGHQQSHNGLCLRNAQTSTGC